VRSATQVGKKTPVASENDTIRLEKPRNVALGIGTRTGPRPVTRITTKGRRGKGLFKRCPRGKKAMSTPGQLNWFGSEGGFLDNGFGQGGSEEGGEEKNCGDRKRKKGKGVVGQGRKRGCLANGG